MKNKGFLIVFEGGDVSGKGTQTQLLADRLRSLGYPAQIVKFPRYGTFTGNMIAEALANKLKISELTMALLYAIDRFEGQKELSALLEQGWIIIADRYVYSNIAHQTPILQKHFQNEDECMKWLAGLEKNMVQAPDLVIYLDVDPEVGFQRFKEERDIYESEKNHQILSRNVYLKMLDMAESENDILGNQTKWFKFDATNHMREVHNGIWKLVEPLVKEKQDF